MRPYRGFRNPSRSFTVAFRGSKLFIKRKFQFRYVARKNLAAFDLLLYIEQITLISNSTFPKLENTSQKVVKKPIFYIKITVFEHQSTFFKGVKDYCSILKGVPQTKIYWL